MGLVRRERSTGRNGGDLKSGLGFGEVGSTVEWVRKRQAEALARRLVGGRVLQARADSQRQEHSLDTAPLGATALPVESYRRERGTETLEEAKLKSEAELPQFVPSV